MKVEKITGDGALIRFDSEEIQEISIMLQNVAVDHQEVEGLANSFLELESITN